MATQTKPPTPAAVRKVTLKTSDNSIFEVEEAIAMEFGTLKSFMEEEGSANSIIPIPNVSSANFAKMIEYCKKHLEFRAKANRLNSGADNKSGDAKAYDDGFVEDQTNEDLKQLILAANYLDFKELLDFLNQTLADRIRNKSVEYVRKFFGIERDFTKEEEKAFREDNAWAFEGVDED